MKNLMIIAASLISFQMAAQNTLKLTVDKIEEVKGTVMFCLYDNEEAYMNPSKANKCIMANIDKKYYEYEFDSIMSGTYAIVVFQDLNDNKTLDTNFMRIPKEPYGFSNNSSTTFGPPSFEKASFKVPESRSVTVSLN